MNFEEKNLDAQIVSQYCIKFGLKYVTHEFGVCVSLGFNFNCTKINPRITEKFSLFKLRFSKKEFLKTVTIM